MSFFPFSCSRNAPATMTTAGWTVFQLLLCAIAAIFKPRGATGSIRRSKSEIMGALLSFDTHDYRALFRSEFCHEIRFSNSRQQQFQILTPEIPYQPFIRPHDGIGEVALGVLQL
jgi:hypothetical protein